MSKQHLLGYHVDTAAADVLCDFILTTLQAPLPGSGPVWLACLNPHSYVVAKDDLEFAQALCDADWLVPDGIGIVVASRMQNGHIRKRTTGFDVFSGLMQRMDVSGSMSVFF